MSARLLTPRYFPALFEATGVRDGWGAHCSGHSTRLSTGSHSSYDKNVDEVSRANGPAMGKTKLPWEKKGKAGHHLRTLREI